MKATSLTHLQIEFINRQSVNPDLVFSTLEQQRDQGTLSKSVASSSLRYQASTTHPSYLEQMTSDGKFTAG